MTNFIILNPYDIGSVTVSFFWDVRARFTRNLNMCCVACDFQGGREYEQRNTLITNTFTHSILRQKFGHSLGSSNSHVLALHMTN